MNPSSHKSLDYGLVLAWLFLLILIVSCQKPTPVSPEVQARFTNHIGAFTQGTISRQDDIVLKMTQDLPELNEETLQKLFEFSPAIKGGVIQLDKRQVVFRPSNPLASGQFYKAKFKLGSVFELPAELSAFPFDFTTKSQAMTVTYKGMQPVDLAESKLQRLGFDVSFYDYLSDDEVESLFSAKIDGKRVPLKWKHSSKVHQITIDSVHRTSEDASLVLSWDTRYMKDKKNGIEQ